MTKKMANELLVKAFITYALKRPTVFGVYNYTQHGANSIMGAAAKFGNCVTIVPNKENPMLNAYKFDLEIFKANGGKA